MRSETSLFDWTLFKKNVTRFWPIWASYLTIWVFVLPVTLVMEYRSYGYNNMAQHIASSSTVQPFMALFFGCFSAMAVLSHLYSPRSANFYGALPIRREGIFLTQYLSGLAFGVAPHALVAAITAVVSAAMTGAAAETLTWLAVGCGMYLFFYTLAVVCGMFAGHILALPVFYAVANCLVSAVAELISILMNHFYVSYRSLGSAVGDAVVWLTPMEKLTGYYWGREDLAPVGLSHTGGGPVLAIYVLAALLMAAGALALYRVRRTESAGDVVAIPVMRPVFKYGVAVCAGLSMGYVTTAFVGEESLPYDVVIWTVLGYFAAQMILDKTFRVFKKWKGAAAAGLAMTALMLAMAFDLTGFDSWVPDPADVTSVTVDGLHREGNVEDAVSWVSTTLTRPEDIEKIVDLHRLALDDPDRNGHMYLFIEYHTKTGTHTREVYFDVDQSTVDNPGTAAYILESIYTDRELYWHLYGFDDLEAYLAEGGKIEYMGYSNFDRSSENAELYPELALDYFQGGEWYLEIVNQNNMQRLWEAVKADFDEGNIGVRHVGDELPGSGRHLTIRWPHERLNGHAGAIPDDFDSQLAIPPTARHTIEALLEILPMEIEAQGYNNAAEYE